MRKALTGKMVRPQEFLRPFSVFQIFYEVEMPNESMKKFLGMRVGDHVDAKVRETARLMGVGPSTMARVALVAGIALLAPWHEQNAQEDAAPAQEGEQHVEAVAQ